MQTSPSHLWGGSGWLEHLIQRMTPFGWMMLQGLPDDDGNTFQVLHYVHRLEAKSAETFAGKH